MEGRVKIIKIPAYSDGDHRHRPTDSAWKPMRPANLWLQKLAEGWMEHRGEAVKGQKYYLDQLPTGYEVFEKTRVSGAVDKRLFGYHRSYFDSPNRFLPHFIHLMENKGSNKGCPCTICSGSDKRSGSSESRSTPTDTASLPTRGIGRGRPPGRGRGLGRGRGQGMVGRPPVSAPVRHVDEEGTEDIYLNMLDKLKKNGKLDEAIEEDMSMDWRAGNMLLKEHLTTTSERSSHLPRLGEIVLFWRTNPRKDTGIHWEAGIVTQTPERNVQTFAVDQVNYTGYRVEPIPDPNTDDKSLSKRFRYVPLSQIRPFSQWKEVLGKVPDTQWQSSVRHSLLVMSTFSLLDTYRFSGTWPAAEISCRGIFIGSELILKGDVVRLMPASTQSWQVTDIMEITSIKLKLLYLEGDVEEGSAYTSVIHITGKAFTTDAARSAGPMSILESAPFAGYAKQWYRRHDPAQSYQVPFVRILGRLRELPGLQQETDDPAVATRDLSEGLHAVREGRAYSSQYLRLIPKGKTWFWADTRAQALALETLNGQEVAAHDKERDPKQWTRQIKVLKGEADGRERQALKAQNERPLRAFEYGNSMFNVALQMVDSEDVSMSDGDSDERREAGHHIIRGDDTAESEHAESLIAQQLDESLGLPMDDEITDDSDEGYSVRERSPAKRMKL